MKEEVPESSVQENVVDSVTPEPQESVPEKIEEETPAVKKPQKPWTPCPPLVFGGSTLLVTLIFLVINYIRARKR